MAPNGAVIGHEHPAKPSRRRARRDAAKVAFVIAVFAAAVSSFPVCNGLRITPAGALFLWNSDTGDNNTYLAKMRAGYRGDWRMTMPFTPEEHEPAFLFPFHVLLGHLARGYARYLTWRTGEVPPTDTTLPLVYNAARTALVFALMWVVYGFAGLFTARLGRRLWAMAFVAFAGGWGPNVSTEAHVLKACILYPHFILSLILYVTACAAFVGAMRRSGRIRWPVCAAIAGFGLGWIHPFDAAPLCAIGGCALVWRWLQRRRFPAPLFLALASFGVFAAAPILYQLNLGRRDSLLQVISQQNILYWHYSLEWAEMLDVYLIVALAGVLCLWKRRRRPEAMFVIVWVVVGAALLDAPFAYQRRLIEGLPVGLAFASLAAVEGLVIRPLARWKRWAKEGGLRAALGRRSRLRRLRNASYATVLLLLAPKTLFVLDDMGVRAFNPQLTYSYLDKAEFDAMKWLEKNTDWRDVVWASFYRGNIIPYLAGNRVFCGHCVETAGAERKIQWSRNWFAWKLPVGEWREICSRYNVAYVYFGPLERSYDQPLERIIGDYCPEALGDPVYSYDGGPQLSMADFKDDAVLVGRLRAGADALSRLLFENLTPETRRQLGATSLDDGEKRQDWIRRLKDDLNRLIQGPCLYTEECFADVGLTQATRALLLRNPSGQELAQLNRRLLEDAYPQALRKIYTVRIYKINKDALRSPALAK